MKPLFICLAGLDGAGKTTQARKLVARLKGKGLPVHYLWGKLNPLLLAPVIWLGRALFLRGQDPYRDYRRYAGTKASLASRPFLGQAFEWLFLADYSLQMLWKVRLPRLRGRYIICDRYVFDTLADLAADFSYSPAKLSQALDRFFTFIPRPDVTFLFDLPEEAAFRRKNDIPSLEYLQRRRGHFLAMAEKYPMVLLDGFLSHEALETQIWDKVRGVLSE